jgi:predicted ATPase
MKAANPEVLARHWTEAGELEPAIAEWFRAGKAAQERNAFAEAEKSYQRALGLLNQLPESAERDLRELELKQSTYLMLTMTKGWAAPETVNAGERITALIERSTNLDPLGYSLYLRGLGAWTAGDLAIASTLADPRASTCPA